MSTNAGRTDTKTLLYLNFIEELSIKESKLISNLMTAEVVEGSRPVGTHRLIMWCLKLKSFTLQIEQN